MHNMNESTLNSLFVYVTCMDVFPPHYHCYVIMTKYFGTENIMQQCSDTIFCIRHLVSNRLFERKTYI